jgi:hypothetical protein
MRRKSTGTEFEDFCTQLGLITVVWAYAENGLGIMLDTIIRNVGEIEGHHEAPLLLKRRLALFKKLLRDVPALQLLRQDGRELAIRFGNLGERRNEFVHRASIHIGDGMFKATSLAVEGRQYAIKEHRFDIGDAVSLVAEVPEFCRDVLDFMARVDAAFA